MREGGPFFCTGWGRARERTLLVGVGVGVGVHDGQDVEESVADVAEWLSGRRFLWLRWVEAAFAVMLGKVGSGKSQRGRMRCLSSRRSTGSNAMFCVQRHCVLLARCHVVMVTVSKNYRAQDCTAVPIFHMSMKAPELSLHLSHTHSLSRTFQTSSGVCASLLSPTRPSSSSPHLQLFWAGQHVQLHPELAQSSPSTPTSHVTSNRPLSCLSTHYIFR